MRRITSVSLCLMVLLQLLVAQEKPTLAVLEFDGFGLSDPEIQTLTNRLRVNLTQLGGYRIIERGLMLQILQEQDFQMTGCTSDECAVEVGQLLGAQFMLAGSLGRVGSTWTIDMRIIDVETGAAIRSASYDTRGEIDQVLTEGLGAATRKIIGVAAPVEPVAAAPAQQPVLKPQPDIQSSTASPRFQVAYGTTQGRDTQQGHRITGTDVRVRWYPWGARQFGSFILLPALTGGKYSASGLDTPTEPFGTDLLYLFLEGSALRSFAGLGLGISYGIGFAFGDDYDERYHQGLDVSGSASLISILTSYRISPFNFVVEAGVFEGKTAFGGWVFSVGVQYYRM
ncbi:MAG: DUF2380 domain-containing protein [Fidelibacterota bacterium]|nr:MAG: DUF2380 domain-containing protein [Candidatus Neomarinimicrobiota bacterium]